MVVVGVRSVYLTCSLKYFLLWKLFIDIHINLSVNCMVLGHVTWGWCFFQETMPHLALTLINLCVWCLRITPHDPRAERCSNLSFLQDLPFFPFSLSRCSCLHLNCHNLGRVNNWDELSPEDGFGETGWMHAGTCPMKVVASKEVEGRELRVVTSHLSCHNKGSSRPFVTVLSHWGSFTHSATNTPIFSSSWQMLHIYKSNF